MSIASVAILSSVIRLQPCRPGGGGKGIAPDPVRVAALARPAEILVSRTVKDLVAGSGITFAERGSHALNGPSDEWPLFAVTGFTAHLSSPDGRPGKASDGGCCAAHAGGPARLPQTPMCANPQPRKSGSPGRAARRTASSVVMTPAEIMGSARAAMLSW